MCPGPWRESENKAEAVSVPTELVLQCQPQHTASSHSPYQTALHTGVNEGSVLQTMVIKTCIVLSGNKQAASRPTGPDKHGYSKAAGQMLCHR